MSAEFATAYDAGLDAGKNGADSINSFYIWFANPESTAEWSRGERDGKTARPDAELSDAKFCRDNNIGVGALVSGRHPDGSRREIRITAIGESAVLARHKGCAEFTCWRLSKWTELEVKAKGLVK